ncbi:hypothetical protein [Clostridium sp. BSD9I1]|uniref:hypothetical protein n=1 Tax=Clostridium sp. BSD9I1 TaxID=2003589 RepID=UPI001645CA72|nr:hypothetical protein [Clostridium sp. BSD9I1]
MKIGEVLRDKDVDNYNKLIKVKDKKKSDNLSECEIRELMSHSCYRRHKGAIKQVK